MKRAPASGVLIARDNGIGGQLLGDKIIARGDDGFQAAVTTAVSRSEKNQRPTAVSHVLSAVKAISGRPKANTAGAVAHATSAVECLLRDINSEAEGGLSDYLKNFLGCFVLWGALRSSISNVRLNKYTLNMANATTSDEYGALQSVMPEDREKQLAAYDQLMELNGIPLATRPRYRAGAEQLMDLDWPTNYIDFGMIDRYHQGLVPRYEGHLSFTAYQRLLREEEATQAKTQRNSLPL